MEQILYLVQFLILQVQYTPVLQLALSMDYSIMLINRYRQEKREI